jgi:hypothetical protein
MAAFYRGTPQGGSCHAQLDGPIGKWWRPHKIGVLPLHRAVKPVNFTPARWGKARKELEDLLLS